jgi:hypothetical protein
MFQQLDAALNFIWVWITIETNWRILFRILFIAIDLHSEFGWDSMQILFRRQNVAAERDCINHIWIRITIETNWSTRCSTHPLGYQFPHWNSTEVFDSKNLYSTYSPSLSMHAWSLCNHSWNVAINVSSGMSARIRTTASRSSSAAGIVFLGTVWGVGRMGDTVVCASPFIHI